MFCEYCGAQIGENDTFCPECGRKVDGAVPIQPDIDRAPQEETVTQEAFEEVRTPVTGPAPTPAGTPRAPKDQPKKEAPLKKILMIAGIAVAAVVVLGVAAIILKNTVFAKKSKEANLFSVDSIWVSPTADRTAVDMMSDDDSYVEPNAVATAAFVENDGICYLYAGKSMIEIAEEKDVDAHSFIGLSSNMLLKDYEGTMFLYDEKGKKKQIGEEGAFKKGYIQSWFGSMNGKYVGFTTNDQKTNDTRQGYVYDGKKLIEIGKNNVPVVISDDGRLLYYIDYNPKSGKQAFIVRKGLNTEKDTELFSDVSDLDDPYINADGKEMILYNDGKSYITANGKEVVKLVSEYVVPILPYGAKSYTTNDIHIEVYDVDSFKDSFFKGGDAIYYMNNKYEMTKVAKHVNTSYCYVANDGKTLFYQDNEGSVYRVNGKKSNASPEKLVDEDSYMFVPAADGKTIFFVNLDDELMAQKGTGKAVTVSDEPDYFYNGQLYDMLLNGKTLFYLEDGELYKTNGGKGEAVKGINQDVENFRCSKSYITINGEEEYLYSKDGKKFSVLLIK